MFYKKKNTLWQFLYTLFYLPLCFSTGKTVEANSRFLSRNCGIKSVHILWLREKTYRKFNSSWQSTRKLFAITRESNTDRFVLNKKVTITYFCAIPWKLLYNLISWLWYKFKHIPFKMQQDVHSMYSYI